MKSKFYHVLLLAALMVGSFLCWNVYSAEKKPNTVVWEYKIVSFVADNTGQLSELGTQGWELASVRTEEQMLGNFRQTRVFYYLKRAQPTRK
jgi:lipopolysaccharide export system protein LptC